MHMIAPELKTNLGRLCVKYIDFHTNRINSSSKGSFEKSLRIDIITNNQKALELNLV
jgi:putative lipoic acid-binding regulatory protein